MSLLVSVAEVRDGFQTEATDTQIELAIAFADGADACLTRRGVPEQTAKALKTYAARHVLSLQANGGRGNVRSETAPSGASRSYGGYTGAEGSSYGLLVKQLDIWGCVFTLIDRTPGLAAFSVGRKVDSH